MLGRKLTLVALVMMLGGCLALPEVTISGQQPERPEVKVKVVEGGESAAKPEDCRATVVGPGVNQPDPFPGYAGFVGWETPVRLKNGTWIVSFNAGYWHGSNPTPLRGDPKIWQQMAKLGMPTNIDAPRGGRAMLVRSVDGGQTWSKPETIIDTEGDDRHASLIELPGGTIICSFFKGMGEGDFEKDPSLAYHVYTVRSFDGGRTWEQKPRPLPTPFVADESDGPMELLKDGSVLLTTNGIPRGGVPGQAAVFSSKDKGKTWKLLSTVKAAETLDESHAVQLPDGRLVMIARPQGTICWSSDGGRTWTEPVTFGMRMFAPTLYVLRDGTLVCLHGSYDRSAPGLRVIFSRDGGKTWIAPSATHGFLVDHTYGYGKAMQLPDGSLYATYIRGAGIRPKDAQTNAIWSIRFRVRPDYSGIDLLPSPGRKPGEEGPKLPVYLGNPFDRWSPVTGEWKSKETVELTELDRREIYRSPEEPSHVAWVGIWKAADGSVFIRFPQITGNPGLDPSYAPWYGRANFAVYGLKTWPELADLLKSKVGPLDALTTTQVDYITMATRDGGNTWEKVSVVPSGKEGNPESRGYNARLVLAPTGELVGKGMATLISRDGRIVDTANAKEYFQEDRAGKRHLIGLRESSDHGKTWTPLQWVEGKYANGKPVRQSSEEHNIVELDDGRILAVIRSDDLQHPIVAWLTRHSNGQYTCDDPVIVTSMPHAGMPNLVRTGDGTIWYWGARHFYSLDDGNTWQGLPDSQAFPAYYGKMVATGENQVLCITQKDIGDAPYPHLHDASIEQIRFSSRRTGILRQTASAAASALIRMNEGTYGDLHVRTDVRLDKAEGVAFRVSPDGKSYYVFAVVMPGTEVRKRWDPPPVQGGTLSAYFPGLLDKQFREQIEKGTMKITPRLIAVLGRVDGGKLTVLRGFNAPNEKSGTWGQMQVKVTGDLIQAAFSDGSSAPTYLGVRDAALKSGGIGLITDGGSQGEFKDVQVWSSPQMIRDLWTIKKDKAE